MSASVDHSNSSSSNNSNAAETSPVGTVSVPSRFANIEKMTHNAKKEHPMYRTTSAEIGAKAPTVANAPTRYYGRKGAFMKEFGAAGNFRASGLNTNLTQTKAMPRGNFGQSYFEP